MDAFNHHLPVIREIAENHLCRIHINEIAGDELKNLDDAAENKDNFVQQRYLAIKELLDETSLEALINRISEEIERTLNSHRSDTERSEYLISIRTNERIHQVCIDAVLDCIRKLTGRS